MSIINKCETERKTNNLLYIVIIFLLVIIAFLAYFLGKNNTWWFLWNSSWSTNGTWTMAEAYDPVTVTVIDDKRCKNCATNDIVSQLQLVPFLANSTVVRKDFSDAWVEQYLKDNEIQFLPAIILSSNKINDEGQMQPFLKELKDKQYFLEIGANYDPLAKRSENGYLLIDKNILNEIKSNAYPKWNKDAKVTWLEYSDLECPYCAKLHSSDVPAKIEETYGNQVNKYFQHFPLDFHKNAETAAMILECLAEQKWDSSFYSLIDKSFKDEKSDKDFLIAEAVKLGANKENLEKCVNDGKYKEKVKKQQSLWTSTFGVTWTPWNVLINNETWEYEVLSWAQPFENFKAIIDELLK